MGFGKKAKAESQKLQNEFFLSQLLGQQQDARAAADAAAADQASIAAAQAEQAALTAPQDNKVKRLSSIFTSSQGLLDSGNIARGRLLGG